MKYINIIKSYLPSKEGKEALENLLFVLRESGVNVEIEEFSDETGRYSIANSTNLGNKEIITSGRSLEELDRNVKDAIFTIFKVPKYYVNFNLINSSLCPDKKLKYATS